MLQICSVHKYKTIPGNGIGSKKFIASSPTYIHNCTMLKTHFLTTTAGGDRTAACGEVAVVSVKGASPPLDLLLSSCLDTAGGDRTAACGEVAVVLAKVASPPLDSSLSSCLDTAGGDRTAACGKVAAVSVKGASPPLDLQLSSCLDTCGWLADVMY